MGASLTTDDPTLDAGTGVFTQTMRFSSKDKIGGPEVGIILDHASRLFKGSLVMNGLTEHVWPPEKVEAHPASDFRSGYVVLATRASKPARPILVR